MADGTTPLLTRMPAMLRALDPDGISTITVRPGSTSAV